MKQNDVFTKRETLRPINTLTCFDSAHSNSLYIIKMKELTGIYKQESELLQDDLSHMNQLINSQSQDIQNEIEPQIFQLKQMLQNQVVEYNNEMEDQIVQLENIRNDNLDLEKEIYKLQQRLTQLDDHIGQQVLQRKYDIKFS
ncbi:unnamed protein product [Paramecium octaurelia]|uniref:Uncharacterized protein n=1 Tax=Paramecium octaurelia TaxID=43137 RepID=A0A8S1TT04_PAROT|nr:unnamed protein product [Paramecium octaurelia]